MKTVWRSAKPLIGYTLGVLVAWVLTVMDPQVDSDLAALFTNIWIVGPVFLVGLAVASALSGAELSFFWGMLAGMAWMFLILGILYPSVMLVVWAIFHSAGVIASVWKFFLVATFIAVVVVAWVRAERDSGS
jgi:hypothetical protein